MYLDDFVNSLNNAAFQALQCAVEKRAMKEQMANGQRLKVLTLPESELVRNGQTIEAIKRLRSRLDIGLKDAKDIVMAHREYLSKVEGKPNGAHRG